MNTQPQPAAAGIRDKLGRLFDAVKFRLAADGRPRFDALGRFVNLRGGRKPKNKMPTNDNKPAEITPAAPPSPEPAAPPAVTVPAPAAAPALEPVPEFSDVRRALGSMPAADGEPAPVADQVADLAEIMSKLPENPTAESLIGIFQTFLVLIGEEEGILTPLEKEMLRRPIIPLLEKYSIGANAMPREIDLALVGIAIVVSRLQRPKTASFYLKCKAWVINKFFASQGEKLANKLRDKVGPEVNPAAERRAA